MWADERTGLASAPGRYAQRIDDAVVLAAVNEVETLTTGLSGKIWQKLMILETHGFEEPSTARSPS